jgi:acetyltransferase-like isoleucine patch superfamily enzyme
MIKHLYYPYIAACLVLPFIGALAPIFLLQGNLERFLATACVPVVWPILFMLVAGVLSWPFRKFIVVGQCARSPADSRYAGRRLHAICWTLVYYSPVYVIYLQVPLLKAVMFRLFGYRGDLRFSIYPDTWVRDLPVLDFGRGAYIANRATLGTNLSLKDGRVLVESITIGDDAMVGHLAMIGAGDELREKAHVSHETACGMYVLFERNCVVEPCCGINHRAKIGAGAVIGGCSYVDIGAEIGPGVRVPVGACIPRRAKILKQQDMDNYFSSETADLERLRMRLQSGLRSDLAGESGEEGL